MIPKLQHLQQNRENKITKIEAEYMQKEEK
jgi:hypothetical protein